MSSFVLVEIFCLRIVNNEPNFYTLVRNDEFIQIVGPCKNLGDLVIGVAHCIVHFSAFEGNLISALSEEGLEIVRSQGGTLALSTGHIVELNNETIERFRVLFTDWYRSYTDDGF